jgi:hypothetical protein
MCTHFPLRGLKARPNRRRGEGYEVRGQSNNPKIKPMVNKVKGGKIHSHFFGEVPSFRHWPSCSSPLKVSPQYMEVPPDIEAEK